MAKKKKPELMPAKEALSRVEKYYDDKEFIQEMNEYFIECIAEHAALGVCSVKRGFYLGTHPLKKLQLYEQYLISLGYTVRIVELEKTPTIEMFVSWGHPTEEAK